MCPEHNNKEAKHLIKENNQNGDNPHNGRNLYCPFIRDSINI
jgi:hypothetical protein